MKKKLKVIGYPWHTTHQYELAKLPFVERYDLLLEPWRRGMSEKQRPTSEKFKFVQEYKRGYYDFAIMHIDQQCVYEPTLGYRVSKGRVFQEANEVIDDVPKIVINHMTPFDDAYESEFVVEWVKKQLDGHTMVCNSRAAVKQWGFGRAIIHGLEVDEWWDLPKEPRCVVVLSPQGMEKAYRREFAVAVQRRLKNMGVPFEWIGATKKAFSSFDEYRDYIGRSLVFFMPTWASPMPRSRTEAMLSGCCVVTTPYQDADTFIEDGVNGYLTSKRPSEDPRMLDNPDYTAELIRKLVLSEPDVAFKVGQDGRKTARDLFNEKRFEEQWRELLEDLGVLS